MRLSMDTQGVRILIKLIHELRVRLSVDTQGVRILIKLTYELRVRLSVTGVSTRSHTIYSNL